MPRNCFGAARKILFVLPLMTFVACAHTRASRPQQKDEMIDVGYGTVPRSSVATAIASLNRNQIDAQRGITAVDLLERVPGVQIERRGDSYTVRVRTATSDPLLVVDGTPLSAGSTVLESLRSSEIERIDVLKDAGATAVYGWRGANGVIVITMRRAR